MAFKATKEWLEAAKLKPVSYNTVLFICGLMSEELPKSSKYKYFNQLRATILSVFPKVQPANTQGKRVLSLKEWLMIGLKKIKIFLSRKESCLS